MSDRNKILTQKYVQSIFDYDPEVGILKWKKPPLSYIQIGEEAGSNTGDGYRRVSIKNRRYKTHRIIWLYTYGYMPEHNIDHINRNKLDNRLSNLREVSQVCNMRNVVRYKTNKSGVKGVCFCKTTNKWMSYIGIKKKDYYLGSYSDFDDAVCARLAAEQCLNWSGCELTSTAYKYVNKNIKKKNV